MKISTRESDEGIVLELGEIFSNTVLRTSEGNELSVCMRDDTIELLVPGTGKWYRVNMKTGEIRPINCWVVFDISATDSDERYIDCGYIKGKSVVKESATRFDNIPDAEEAARRVEKEIGNHGWAKVVPYMD